MATKTQGTIFSVQSAIAVAQDISSITKANPAVITLADSPIGIQNDDIVKITDVVGMQEMNSRALIATSVTGGHFGAKGVNSTNYTAYTSGGKAAKVTMTPVGTVEGIPTLFSGTSPKIKATHLLSLTEEYIQGLQDEGDNSLSLIFKSDDPGQVLMQYARETQAETVFTVTLSDGTKACFCGFVSQFSISIAANDVVKANCSIITRAGISRFA